MSQRVISLDTPSASPSRGSRSRDKRQVKLTHPTLGSVVLPWWPDEIAWSGMAATFDEQERPGRRPLLLRSGVGLEELRIGTVIRGRDIADEAAATESGSIGATIAEILSTLRVMSQATKPVTVSLAGRAKLYRITDLGITEIDWGSDGNPLVAEVSMTLLEASEAAIPVGPIRRGAR